MPPPKGGPESTRESQVKLCPRCLTANRFNRSENRSTIIADEALPRQILLFLSVE
jgi:hypothetical protein